MSDYGSQNLGAGLCLVDQAVMDCVKRQFQPVRYTQLIENIVQVILHRLLADEEKATHGAN
jgi:hypothetical protein